MKILLERDDVNPDKPTWYGQTALCCAAERGYEGVVKILLAQDKVNPNKPDDGGRTPLWWATRHGHTGAVSLLHPLGYQLDSEPVL